MSAIIILVIISISVAAIFLLLFYKAVNNGQYEEFESPAVRALSDDELCSSNLENNQK
jgi:cbb3-type cytochrome oxidase maturation protein